jgi:hypothetical protein
MARDMNRFLVSWATRKVKNQQRRRDFAIERV